MVRQRQRVCSHDERIQHSSTQSARTSHTAQSHRASCLSLFLSPFLPSPHTLSPRRSSLVCLSSNLFQLIAPRERAHRTRSRIISACLHLFFVPRPLCRPTLAHLRRVLMLVIICLRPIDVLGRQCALGDKVRGERESCIYVSVVWW